jgi:uncharacterized protein YybS (DUF2232 family)
LKVGHYKVLDKSNAKKVYTALVGLGILFALLCAIEFLPTIVQVLPLAAILVPASVFAVPLVLTYVLVYSGFNYGISVGAVAFGACLLLDFSTLAYIATAFVPVAIVAAFMITKAKRLRTSFVGVSFAALVGIVGVIGIIMYTSKMNIVDYLVSYYGNQLKIFSDSQVAFLYNILRYTDLISGAVTQQAIDATAAADAIVKMQDILRDTLNVTLVNIIIIYSMGLGYLTYIISRAVVKKAGQSVVSIAKFKDYALPKRFWLLALVTAIVLILAESLDWSGYEVLQATLYSIFVFVFMVQGLCLLVYWLDFREMGKGARVILIIASVLFLQASLLPLAGLLENAIGIRGHIAARKAEDK